MKPRPPIPERWGVTHGAQHWAELHGSYVPGFLQGWIERIGCPTCRQTAEAIVAQMQPRDNLAVYEWRVWTWDFHNAVSAHLGRPGLCLAAANDRWAWELPAWILEKAAAVTKVTTHEGSD